MCPKDILFDVVNENGDIEKWVIGYLLPLELVVCAYYY